MKARTIQKILAGKHAAWCKSITDEAVRKVAEENTIITGGAIVSLLLNEPVSDFDCYFRDAASAAAIARYYVAKLKESPPPAFKGDAKHTVEIYVKVEDAIPERSKASRIGGEISGPQPARVRIVVKSAGIAGEDKQEDYQYFEGLPANEQAAATDAYVGAATGDDEVAHLEDGPAEGQITDDSEPEGLGYMEATTEADDISAETLEEDKPKSKEEAAKRGKYRPLFVTSNAITLSDKMQLIIRFQGEPDQIHENYDYVHCTSAFTSWDKKLTLRPDALECILTKELRYVGSKYPICSLIRTRKFIKRGWTINAGQFVKMAWQVSRLDLSNPAVLEDQLVGVDSAYFAQVISALKARLEKQTLDEGERVEVDGMYLISLIDKIF